MHLDGKTIIITGASSGIGAAAARLFAAAGGAVVLGARVREVTEQSDYPQLADALEPRGLGEDDTVVSRRDAVAPEPGLKLEVHADGPVD